ncbi:MAG: EAL domain-containing response regulator [Candidatus Sumerlaeia bacterium]|nr:EAL domain-containing response regulator [Candidatus Sumerlaeia bacterium]
MRIEKEKPMTGKRLLIIDDDPMIGRTISAIAESISVETIYTVDAGEFFQHAADWAPTHIAVDLVMPEMDGIQVLAELAHRGCNARIIITSGQGHRILEAAKRSAAWRGLNIIAVLGKPFSPASLRELLMESGNTSSVVDRLPGSLEQGAMYEFREEELQQALNENQFHLVYQPKLECQSGNLAGFEALVRWQQPGGAVVPPDRFIPLAERTGLIDSLTEHVLDEGIAWFSGFTRKLTTTHPEEFERNVLGGLTLSINISVRTLANSSLMESIENRCLMWKVPTSSIIFELTETSAMEDPVFSLDLLTRLRLKGFQLSIDDFGTGFSSMLQLVRLPFSEIKVDKSFVMTASDSAEHRTVIKSIVGLGHNLGLKCTAEGLEDPRTLQYLRDVGCDLVQGYHISRPLRSDQIEEWVMEKLGLS